MPESKKKKEDDKKKKAREKLVKLIFQKCVCVGGGYLCIGDGRQCVTGLTEQPLPWEMFSGFLRSRPRCENLDNFQSRFSDGSNECKSIIQSALELRCGSTNV